MNVLTPRSTLLAVTLVAALPLFPQATSTVPAAPAAPAAEARQAERSENESAERPNSHQTREELHQLLRQVPPQVSQVLELDPTMWTNASYMNSYPDLAAFVAKHPEVARSPEFFLEGVGRPAPYAPDPPNVRAMRDTMESVSVFVVLLTFVGVGTWLIRTIIEQRRWSRVSRIQAEVQNKLLDRFSTNQELLAYLETRAGRQFLEFTPIPVETSPREVHAPLNRILWSVQAGVVLGAFGIGLAIVSSGVEREVAGPMGGMGTLAIAVGLGLIVSAAAAYMISKRLGLWQTNTVAAETGTLAD
jgi:hypothetical protein